MSRKFGGFSQDEIQKIRASSATSLNKENSSVANTARRPIAIAKANQKPSNQANRNTTTNATAPTVNLSDVHASIFDSDASSAEDSLRNALHFKPLPVPQRHHTDNEVCSAMASNNIEGNNGKENVEQDSVESPGTALIGVSLREYEAQRRMKEEQNQHRKQMIYNAIEQRSKQTAAEAMQLQLIKDDLTKMEADLAEDVTILRRKIEKAAIRYNAARHYYEQIEGVFLKAKLSMQQAREQKDLLGEHLNIIINHTEDRKEKKLTELLNRMGLNQTEATSPTAST